MIYRAEYIYKVDGFYDSINYYKSATPMSVDDMPMPTATGINSLSYTDSDIGVSGKYYVRFSTIRNSVEKISSEKIVLAGKFQTFINTDNSQIVDLCSNNVWENTNTVSVSGGIITFGASQLRNTSKTINLSSDFHLHLRHKVLELGTFNIATIYRSVIALSGSTNTLLLVYTGSGMTGTSINTGSNNKHRYSLLLYSNISKSYCSLSNIVAGVEYEIDLIRKNNTFYLYVDKALQFSAAASVFGTLVASSEMVISAGLSGNTLRDIWVKTESSDIVLPT